jgi:hypothetical protein
MKVSLSRNGGQIVQVRLQYEEEKSACSFHNYERLRTAGASNVLQDPRNTIHNLVLVSMRFDIFNRGANQGWVSSFSMAFETTLRFLRVLSISDVCAHTRHSLRDHREVSYLEL